jgi:hypothetical protein
LGVLSHCFNCSIPHPRFGSYRHTRETLKKGSFVHTPLSTTLSLSLSRLSSVKVFYFSFSRRSRFFRSTQSSGVTSHYSVDSQDRCPCPALQTPYIYGTSYYYDWDRVPAVPSSSYVRTLSLQKLLTNILQISIPVVIQMKKIILKEKNMQKSKRKTKLSRKRFFFSYSSDFPNGFSVISSRREVKFKTRTNRVYWCAVR